MAEEYSNALYPPFQQQANAIANQERAQRDIGGLLGGIGGGLQAGQAPYYGNGTQEPQGCTTTFGNGINLRDSEAVVNRFLMSPGSSHYRTTKFFRINKRAEIVEGAKYEEPLDELRIEVARWLN